MPTAAFSDPRLTLRDLRVLGAICYFADQKTGKSPPDRKAITALTGLPETRVSMVTSRLQQLGWISKQEGRGRHVNSIYTIHWDYVPPEKVTDSDTFLDKEKVTNPDTFSGKGYQSGYLFEGEKVTDSATFSDNRSKERARSGNKLNISDTDQIRSDLNTDEVGNTTSETGFGLTEAINTLASFGMPLKFVSSVEDRQTVLGWVRGGVTQKQLIAACQHAIAHKRDGKPIGPRYIDQVLRSISAKGEPDATRISTGNTGFGKGDAVGEAFLREQQSTAER